MMNSVLLLLILVFLVNYGECVKIGEVHANESSDINEDRRKRMRLVLESEAASLITTEASKVAGPNNSRSDLIYSCGCGDLRDLKNLVENFKNTRSFALPCSKCGQSLSLPDFLKFIDKMADDPATSANEKATNTPILSMRAVNTLISINAQIKDLQISADQTIGTFEIEWAGEKFKINLDNRKFLNLKGADLLTLSMILCGIHGNIDILKVFISLGADINATPKNKGSLLQLAIKHNKIAFIEYLISIGIILDIETINYGFITHYALQLDNLHVLRLLLNAGANLESVDKEGKTILTKAIETNNRAALALLSNYYPSAQDLNEIIDKIIEADDAEAMGKVFNLKLIDSTRTIEIIANLAANSTKIFQYLFKNFNFSKSVPLIAFYHAIKAGKMDNVDYLISRGYGLNTIINGEIGILAYTISYNDEVVVKKLLELGTKPTEETQIDKVMIETIKKGNPNMLKLIFGPGMKAFQDLGFERIRKSLVFACKVGNLGIIEDLYSMAGSKFEEHRLAAAYMSKNEEIFINFLNRGFTSSLSGGLIHFFMHNILMEGDRPRSIEAALQKGANIYLELMTDNIYANIVKANPAFETRITRYEIAAVTALLYSRTKSMEVILKSGFNPNVRIFSGSSTLLHLACELNNIEMAGLLLKYGADNNALDNNHMAPFSHTNNPELFAQLQNMNHLL